MKATFIGALATLCVLGAGCDDGLYTCETDANCVIEGRSGGQCLLAQDTGYCAFPKADCASGFVWDSTAPGALAGTCVIEVRSRQYFDMTPVFDMTHPDLIPPCPGTQALCNNNCYDVSRDNYRCGDCVTQCPKMGAATCVSGACQCDVNTTNCSGVCVYLLSDPKNCNGCGVVCASSAPYCEYAVCKTDCAGAFACFNQCAAQPCVNDCVAHTGSFYLQLLANVRNCLNKDCPVSGGGVCDFAAGGFTLAGCQACRQTSIQGSCNAAYQNCQNPSMAGP